MTSLLHDLRYAVRQLLRTPGFTAAAVMTLALGIGVNTAFFAVVNAVVFRPIRAVDLENVWRPSYKAAQWSGLGMPLAHARFVETHLPEGITAISTVISQPVLAHTEGHAERVEAEYVSGGHAAVFNLRPQAGRFITRDDDRGVQRTIVISDRIWREWFGADRSVVEKTFIKINDDTFLVVGVAPFGYRGNLGFGLSNTDFWLPLNALLGPNGNNPGITAAPVSTIVRLAPGVSRYAAAEQLTASVKDLPMGRRTGPFVVTLRSSATPDSLRRPGYLIMGFAALVLLAACANLANMLYTRGSHRAAEVAVRQSLGATSGRVFRLFLVEATLIAIAASSAGLVLALSATSLLQAAFPSFRDRATRISIDLTPDYRVFAFAFGAGVAATLVVGVISAWKASRVPPQRAMASGDAATSITRTSRRVRLGLVAVQVTGAVVLLMAAGLYLRQTHGAFEYRLTFDSKPLAAARLDLSRHGYNDERARVFLDKLVADVRAMPGMQSAAIADGIPGGISMGGAGAVFAAEKSRGPVARYIDGSYKRIAGTVVAASTGYLRTIDLPLESGRDLNDGDVDGAELIAVVSRSTAAHLWGSAPDALGKRIMIGNEGHWRRIVGICADPATRKSNPFSQLQYTPANLMIVPLQQRYQPPRTERETQFARRFRGEVLVVVRSEQPRGQLDPLRLTVRNLDSNVALFDAASLDDSILSWAGPLRAARLLMITIALLALAISVTGIYGVLSFIVARRRREFGIRIALGAERRQVLKMIFDEALHLLLVGLLAGVLVAALGERTLTARRYGMPPNEISTWVVVLLLILTVGLAAALLPARRAASIDPNVALRDL
ncbi:MAG: FtsX-like permease family protein [Vicinamibacterales bacterium]